MLGLVRSQSERREFQIFNGENNLQISYLSIYVVVVSNNIFHIIIIYDSLYLCLHISICLKFCRLLSHNQSDVYFFFVKTCNVTLMNSVETVIMKLAKIMFVIMFTENFGNKREKKNITTFISNFIIIIPQFKIQKPEYTN